MDVRKLAWVAAMLMVLPACPGSHASTNSPPTRPSSPEPSARVTLNLATAGGANVAADVPRSIRVVVGNATSHRLGGLWLATSDAVGGSPGSAQERWAPPFHGRCYAGMSTGYCPLPTLAAHAVYRMLVTVVVPRRLAGRSTAGREFVQTAFVTNRPPSTHFTPKRVLTLRITGPSEGKPHR